MSEQRESTVQWWATAPATPQAGRWPVSPMASTPPPPPIMPPAGNGARRRVVVVIAFLLAIAAALTLVLVTRDSGDNDVATEQGDDTPSTHPHKLPIPHHQILDHEMAEGIENIGLDDGRETKVADYEWVDLLQ